jgi:hypothetical protein
MFSGYQQHDTQEFLNYLLDGVHEDLNKVLKKPLVEKDESKKHDDMKSKESWIGFLRRNQSILVDLLYGQYKSTLYCPNENCANISTTFDPFLSISLPLVAKTHPYYIECYFIFYDSNVIPIKIKVPFASECTIMAFRNKISLLLNIHPFSFIVGKLDNGTFEGFINSTSLLGRGYGSEKTLFLMQIDPVLFYSNENKKYFDNNNKFNVNNFQNISDDLRKDNEIKEKIFDEDYDEVEEGQTGESVCYYSRNYTVSAAAAPAHKIDGKEMKINTDENYGFNSDYLKVLLFLKSYDDFSNNTSVRRRIVFPRITYVNKNMTTKGVHLQVFKFFLPMLDKYERKQNPDYTKCDTLEEKFNYFFKDYDTNPDYDTVEYQKQHGFPYRIRMKNINTFYFDNCYFCGRQRCDDCMLPFDDNLTINEIIEKIPKNDGLTIDNTFLFLKESQRFHAVKNKDFNFEITFLPKFYEAVKQLNDFEDLTFTTHKSSGPKSVKIEDCFKLFVKLEKLKENNEWYCPQCKEFQKASKKMEIYKAPHLHNP